jgi:hypothetical protein
MSYLDRMPEDTRAVHFCTLCRSAYDSLDEAVACAARETVHPFKVGDIVTEPAPWPRYGWHDGPDHWVNRFEKPDGSKEKTNTNGRDWRGMRSFYWVVTAVGFRADVYRPRPFGGHPAGHKPIYWVRTLGLCNGMEGGRGGWTSNETHQKFELVKKPPARVVRESKALIGFKADFLL